MRVESFPAMLVSFNPNLDTSRLPAMDGDRSTFFSDLDIFLLRFFVQGSTRTFEIQMNICIALVALSLILFGKQHDVALSFATRIQY